MSLTKIAKAKASKHKKRHFMEGGGGDSAGPAGGDGGLGGGFGHDPGEGAAHSSEANAPSDTGSADRAGSASDTTNDASLAGRDLFNAAKDSQAAEFGMNQQQYAEAMKNPAFTGSMSSYASRHPAVASFTDKMANIPGPLGLIAKGLSYGERNTYGYTDAQKAAGAGAASGVGVGTGNSVQGSYHSSDGSVSSGAKATEPAAVGDTVAKAVSGTPVYKWDPKTMTYTLVNDTALYGAGSTFAMGANGTSDIRPHTKAAAGGLMRAYANGGAAGGDPYYVAPTTQMDGANADPNDPWGYQTQHKTHYTSRTGAYGGGVDNPTAGAGYNDPQNPLVPYVPHPTTPTTPTTPTNPTNPNTPTPLPDAGNVGGGSPGSADRGMGTQEMQDYFKRRKDIQTFFTANQNDPQAVMDAMTKYGVSAAELKDTMGTSINTDAWLRDNGAKDGFGGLKVYSPEQVQNFQDWASTANVGAYNNVSKMAPSQAMAMMARDDARKALGSSSTPEYLGDWRAALAQKKQDDAARAVAEQAASNPHAGGIQNPAPGAAKGGVIGHGLLAASTKSRYIDGPGTGLSDSVPVKMDDGGQGRLADGEFVISADVVSGLGGGSSKAGAKELYAMMERIRKKAHGTKQQVKAVTPRSVLPA